MLPEDDRLLFQLQMQKNLNDLPLFVLETSLDLTRPRYITLFCPEVTMTWLKATN